MEKASLLSALALLGVSITGCSESTSCPDVLCPPTLTISMAKSVGQFPRQSYTITTVADGSPDTCNLEITGDFAASSDCGVFLFASTENETLRFYNFISEPVEFRFSFRAGDSLLADTTFAPVYQHVQLHGPECGTCPRAFAEILIP